MCLCSYVACLIFVTLYLKISLEHCLPLFFPMFTFYPPWKQQKGTMERKRLTLLISYRDIFRALSNIHDGAFLWKYDFYLLTKFTRKTSIIDMRWGPKILFVSLWKTKMFSEMIRYTIFVKNDWINSFLVNVSNLYSLKTPENLRFFHIFRRYDMRLMVRNRLIFKTDTA